MLALLRCRWPGNIRQLRNVTRQLVIGSRGRAQLRLDARLAAELGAGAVTAGPPVGAAPGAITVGPPAAAAGAAGAPPEGEDERATIPPPTTVVRRRPADVTEAELVAALRASAWDLKAAADALGIQRASIYNVIARSPNVRTAGDLSPEEIERCYRECDGDLDRMVERLEVSRRALRRRVKELGLDVD
jgi:two-component system nitrogen regulation response regulator GlnG